MRVKSKTVKFVISITLPFLAAFVGSYFTTPSIATWYAYLNKPTFSPPNWIFAPVWTLLYILMGISFYIIWGASSKKNKGGAMGVYIAQLVLNSMWSIVFFGLHNLGLALVVIAILWVLILLTIIRFYKFNKIAGIILIPYILWVSFASFLNLTVFLLNR